MRVVSFVPVALTAIPLASALPRAYEPIGRRSSINSLLNDVLVFDAPAFDDPANPGNTLVQLQAFVSTPEISATPLLDAAQPFLQDTIGLNITNDLDRVASRLALFTTIGLGGKDVPVTVGGCGTSPTLQGTASNGMAIQNISLGACGGAQALGKVNSETSSNFTLFPASADGFGVISDIDDTVKVTHTLDKLLSAKATLIDTPVPVTGMPDVYASLAQSLNNPQFIYVSAGPFQLYPFLKSFIETTFAPANGPIMLNNLTTTNISQILDFSNLDGVFDYKSAMIDRIHGMYPGKTFLAVGDSTQKDPETYGNAIRKYGDFIQCAWIRLVDGANNTDARFAAAFEGVDPSKFKLYNDTEIPSLANIDVAGGKCS
ncbi:DUF2183 domain-containing protein [Mycena chlorophos]|uniref:DUF2183 domain-containing protein n=1 Tax=Mycena chlorophos TaxID=658473 RepID=A0A8H6S1J1_MYCCL|nr:DUF2183 domain-containing protein [Mycena chlorophos]